MMSGNQPSNERKPTCFVISPIDKQDSEIRKNADKLYDYILKPVVEVIPD